MDCVSIPLSSFISNIHSIKTMESFILLQLENLPFTGQDLLQNIFTDRSRIRDYHNNDRLALYGAQIIVANIVTTKMNCTVIAKGHPKFIDDGRYPKIIPVVYQYDSEMDMLSMWKMFGSSLTGARPMFIQFDSNFLGPCNFVYCTTHVRRQDSLWDFSIFTDPFDWAIWSLLMLSLLSVGVIAFSSFSRKDISAKLLSSLAPLLNIGSVTGGNSKLFILWMFTCLILVNVYTGELTSKVIIPPPDESISNIEQLEKNNYTLFYGLQGLADLIKSDADMFTRLGVFEGQILQRMTSKTVVWPNLGIGEEYVLGLVSQDKMASFASAAYVMWIASNANEMVRTGTNLSSQILQKKCYVGKELVSYGHLYFTFIPPKSVELAAILSRLVDAGIVRRWYDESTAVMHSARVQDRVKVISPTQLVDDKHSVNALALQGNIVTIFLSWMFGLVGSLLRFSYERGFWIKSKKCKIPRFLHL